MWPGMDLRPVLGFGLLMVLCGCMGPERTLPASSVGPAPRVELLKTQTISDIGAGQAMAIISGRLLVMGDAGTGIVREYSVDLAGMLLVPSGRSITLTRDGSDFLSHPTGLAHDDRYGSFIGNTVKGVGSIHCIDLERALAQGTLDGCVINSVADTAAVNGSRPEFIVFGGRRVIATSDYGRLGNQIRLLDPAALSKSSSTSDAGVQIAALPAGPWVQQMHWIERWQTLVLVQNQVAGLRYRLTFVEGVPAGMPAYTTVDLQHPDDELEGFVMLNNEIGLMLSASRKNNLHWVRLDWPAKQR